MRAVEWLWTNMLPRGMFVVLAGEPEAGKSTLASLVAAILTTGGDWPDGDLSVEPCNVAWWTGEEAAAETLVPRWHAAGADLTRVDVLDRDFDPGNADHVLDLTAHCRIRDTRMLVLDPVVTAAAGARDGNQAGDVRKSLEPYIRLAEETGALVLGISHFAKGSRDRPALERLYGSGAWGQKARIVHFCTKIVDSDERALIRIKSNIGPSGGGIKYRVDEACFANPARDEPTQTATIKTPRASFVGGWFEGRGDDLLRGFTTEPDHQEKTLIEEGMEIWTEQRGQLPHVTVTDAEEAGRANGINARTMRRARERLGWKTRKIGTAWVAGPP